MIRPILAVLVAAMTLSTTSGAQRTSLRLQSDEALAALEIVDLIAPRREPAASDWSTLFASDGYQRLKRREAAMGRAFSDSSFADFLRADSTVAKRGALRQTLGAWQRMNTQSAATQALAWLPRGAHITATIYLLIKPRTNSFVFDADTDPAIMMYLDPAKSASEYANHVMHELHHIGYASVCGAGSANNTTASAQVRMWLGAFGEGFAMLAAAGSFSAHPHAASSVEDKRRWDAHVANFDANLHAIEDFARRALDGAIPLDSIAAHAQQFYGVQGPWYTVGYTMATVIGEESGKGALLAAMCNPLDVMRAFNVAANTRARRTGARLATWDAVLLERLQRA